VTKVLIHRLNSKLDKLIDTVQTGFIKGRYIMDRIAVAQEIISNFFRENIIGGMLVKLDLQKLMIC